MPGHKPSGIRRQALRGGRRCAAAGKAGQPAQPQETEESLAAAAAAEAARAGLTETDLSSFRHMRSKGYHQMIVQNAAKKFSRK